MKYVPFTIIVVKGARTWGGQIVVEAYLRKGNQHNLSEEMTFEQRVED